MLDENLAWTTDLGQAFLNQPADVMDSVQRLRAQAQAMGNLLSTPQQTVVVDGGIIVVNHTTIVNQNFTVWRPRPSGVARGKHRQAAGGQGTCSGDRAASQWPASFRPSSGASTAAESAHSCAERYSSCCCAGCFEAALRGYQRSATCRSAGDSTSVGDWARPAGGRRTGRDRKPACNT
jgi:hypothetical protein